MKIEVAVPTSASTKDKGDLLEKLSSELTMRQSYDVTEEIRIAACELDLLCKHKVSARKLQQFPASPAVLRETVAAV